MTKPESPWILWLAGLLLVLLMFRGAWRGYQRGPLRQLAGPFSLSLGLLAGWCFGPEFGHSLLHKTDYPWLLRGVTGIVVLTCVVGLLTYGIIWWVGRRPKGMDEAENPLLGALVGCWTGVLYFSILLLILASVASIVELIEGPEAPKSWSVQAVQEIANTPATSWLKTWSPIPDRQKKLFTQLREIVNNPQAMKKVMETTEIRALASHPTLYQAWNDKKVRELLTNKDLSGFFSHPKIRAVLADEELQKQADSMDLPEIIDRALVIHK